MKYRLFLGLLTSLVVLVWAISSHAILLDFVPANQTVVVGNPLTVDVVISGLDAANEIVSAFDLDVTYDSSILSATNVTFGLDLGDPSIFEALTDFTLLSPGVVDFAELSLLSDTDLASLQGDSVTLATLAFDAVEIGQSTLNFGGAPPINDVKGRNNEILPLTVGTGNVAVAPIPEPSTMFLFGSGLAGLVGMRLLQARKK